MVEEVDTEGAGRTLVPTATDMAARTSRRVDAVFGNADAQHTQFFGRIDAATPQTTSSHIGEPIPSGHRVAKHLRMPEASARDIGSARGVRVVVTAFSLTLLLALIKGDETASAKTGEEATRRSAEV